jgi:hypothetical protein
MAYKTVDVYSYVQFVIHKTMAIFQPLKIRIYISLRIYFVSLNYRPPTSSFIFSRMNLSVLHFNLFALFRCCYLQVNSRTVCWCTVCRFEW